MTACENYKSVAAIKYSIRAMITPVNAQDFTNLAERLSSFRSER